MKTSSAHRLILYTLSAFLTAFCWQSLFATVNLNVNTALCFSDMDNNATYDEDAVSGQITVSSLVLETGGSISSNDPGSLCSYAGVGNDGAKNMIFIVNGGMEMQAGSALYAENRIQAGTGGFITITVSGSFTMRGTSGATPGAIISSSNLSGTGGAGGGDISITVVEDVVMEPGSVIKSFAFKPRAGAITITGAQNISIEGQVLAESGGTGSGCNPGYGGFIQINASQNLFISDDGKVSSKGLDPGADLVHLSACNVTVYGLVQSTGSGHGVPSCPPNHLGGGNATNYRPDKPGNSTAGVEIWAAHTLLIDNANHNGEINADLCCAGGTTGISWIDLFSMGEITIVGSTNSDSPFAVHANGKAGNSDDGGLITIKSAGGRVFMSGRATQSNGTSDGGTTTIEATGNVDVSDAKMESKSTNSGGSGGVMNIRSFGVSPDTGSIISNANSSIDVGPLSSAAVNLTACGDIGFPPGSILPVTVTPTKDDTMCGGDPTLSAYVIF